MNDGLLALKRLKGEGRGNGVYDEIDVDQDFDRAEYYLQVIDIIKEKGISLWALKSSNNVEQYNSIRNGWKYNARSFVKDLTEEEFSHLKEVFDND